MAKEQCGRESVSDSTIHRARVRWIHGRMTGQLIRICDGWYGGMHDFHVLKWQGEDDARDH
jgi:hypothetical protein